MLTASLKAFKKKTKPGPTVLSHTFRLSRGSWLFARQLFSFSTPAETPPSIDPCIENKILSITQDFLASTRSSKRHRLTKTVTFSSLGLDSVDCIDLVIELEEKLGMDISNADADRISSVHEASTTFSRYARKQGRVPQVDLVHNSVGGSAK
jgi:acyl carrier protein